MKYLVLMLLTIGLTCPDALAAAQPKILSGDVLDAKGKRFDAAAWQQADYRILYFSAHWCPPCRTFTPKFVEWYQDKAKQLGAEVLLVSSDKNVDKMQEYLAWGNMPWGGIWKGSKTGQHLSQYAGKGIPCVVVFNKQGVVIAHSYDDNGQYQGPAKPLQDLEAMAQ
jgi:nucleoredoxin